MPNKLEPAIINEINEFCVRGRTESASFLLWFLINIFRIDTDDAKDLICDSRNDKGIDGIYVDDQAGEIVIFQSKYPTGKTETQGDNDIRNFIGASKWFESADTIEALLQSTASEELKSLIIRLDISRKLQEGFSRTLAFITSVPFDGEANDLLSLQARSGNPINAWDSPKINTRISDYSRENRVMGTYTFTIERGGHYDRVSRDGIRIIILPLKAREIALLNGIDDRSLFARNVRLPIGSTRVNRDIKAAIQTPEEHSKFILYHNGITILCDDIRIRGNKLFITNYSVVNGCQSVTSFYENNEYLTNELSVLVKLIRVTQAQQALSDEITYRSNNQNPTNMRDQRSNDRIQLDLQSEINRLFGDRVRYLIKRGEQAPAGIDKLPNDLAAQVILAFYLKRPEITHQKWRHFDEFYSEIFSRHLDAPKVYFAYRVYKVIESVFPEIEDELIRGYGLAKYFLLEILKRVLERDELGRIVVNEPMKYIPEKEQQIIAGITQLARLIIRPFNYVIRQRNERGYFNYKSDFKSRDRINEMANEICSMYDSGLVLHPEGSPMALFKSNGI